jgi:hypothetical protein
MAKSSGAMTECKKYNRLPSGVTKIESMYPPRGLAITPGLNRESLAKAKEAEKK